MGNKQILVKGRFSALLQTGPGTGSFPE